MELNARKLADLIKALRSNPTIASDKRKQPRVGIRAKAHVVIVTEEGMKQAVPVCVRDLSSGGVGFTTAIRIENGSVIQLLLSRDAKQSFTCKVAHCRQVGPNVFQIGAKFSNDAN